MRIVAFVRGLFGLVDSQESGRGLSELSETMAATVDVTDLLGLNRIKEESIGPFGGPSVTMQFAHTVPNDKVWRVRSWGGYYTTGAGVTTAGVYGGVVLSNLAAGFPSALTDSSALGAGSQVAFCAKNLPLWLPPGSSLVVFGLWAGGNPAFFSRVVYDEIDA